MTDHRISRSAIIGAAAGLLVLAGSAPAWAQASIYPEGTDCSAIQNSANRVDCMTQLHQQLQNGSPDVTPLPGTNNGTQQPNPNPPVQNDTLPKNGTTNGTGGDNGPIMNDSTGTGGAVQ